MYVRSHQFEPWPEHSLPRFFFESLQAKARMILESQHKGFHPNSAVILTVNIVLPELLPVSLNKIK
jgi:hypothetical protein